MNRILFKKLHPDAIIPTRANNSDAGMDLYALADVEIPATKQTEFIRSRKEYDRWENVIHHDEQRFITIGQVKIPTGLAVEIPHGHYGKVSSRSGLAFKNGLFSFDGTIDAGYRGEIGILLYNTTDKPYLVEKGDKVAQLLIIPCSILKPVEVEELSVADRGANGFGSSGR